MQVKIWELRDWASKPVNSHELLRETAEFYVVKKNYEGARRPEHRMAKNEDTFKGDEEQAYREIARRKFALADKLRKEADLHDNEAHAALVHATSLLGPSPRGDKEAPR